MKTSKVLTIIFLFIFVSSSGVFIGYAVNKKLNSDNSSLNISDTIQTQNTNKSSADSQNTVKTTIKTPSKQNTDVILTPTDVDFKELDKLLHAIANSREINITKKSSAYIDCLVPIMGDACISELYIFYFGEDYKYYIVDDQKDPLGRFDKWDSYRCVPAENVDWIIKNIFNIEPKINSLLTENLYYYNNNYYVKTADMGVPGYIAEITEKKQLNDGSYEVSYNIYWSHDFEIEKNYDRSQKILCFLKEIDGKRQWTIKSIYSFETCYTAYDNIKSDYVEKWYNNPEYPYIYHQYTYHDIDEDGTEELIIHDGTCEQDRTYYFYTYSNGKVIYLGSTDAWHSTLSDGYKKIILSNGMNGEGTYYYLTIIDNKIVKENAGTYTFPPSPDFGTPIIFKN